MRPFSLIACLSLLLLGTSVATAEVVPNAKVLAAQKKRIQAIAKASASTVAVFDSTGQGGGSGVVISPEGFALTNFHVTAPCGTAMTCGMSDGKVYDAVIVGIDPVGDVALIQLLGRDDFPVAKMADSDRVKVGDWVFAIGNPFLLADDLQPSVSYGIVSGVRRYQYPAGTLLEYTDCIQTDAAINPGNSGGPLFNAAGKLIGINGRGSFEKRGRVNVGVGYAISINQIKRFLSHLKSGRIVDHATLGATVATDETGKVLVDDILESCDAYRRGLRYGDEIVRFAGREITSANLLKNVLGVFPNGWSVPIVYRREGETFDINVRLMGLHDQSQLFDLVQAEARKPSKPHQENPSDPEGKEPNKDSQDKPKITDLLKKKPEIPQAVADRFKARRGFANFWYNREKQQQLWNLYRGEHAEDTVNYAWKIYGKLANGKPFEIETTAENATCRMPTGFTGADFSQDLETQLSPPGSGGLLLTLHLWQRFLDKGLRQFGEVYYLGQLPTGPEGQWLDCLVGTYSGIETHFLFTPGTGKLIAIEVFPDETHDPCLLWFSEFSDSEGQTLPKRWQVFHAGKQFADFYVEKLTGGSHLFPPATSALPIPPSPSVLPNAPTRQAVREAQSKVVKIYGAGGLRKMEAYQSGILISPQGHVLTMFSYVLDTDDLVAILDDGRKFQLEFLRSDPIRDIAILRLKAEGETLPYFDLHSAIPIKTGERVLALSNLFGIATGNEAVSVLQGVITATAPLAARRGAFQANYQEQVYVLDAYANNPGAAGGALVDWQGRLLGILGKELRSEVTGTWLNYALPAEALAKPVDDLLAGKAPVEASRFTPEQPLTIELLGLRLVPNVLSRTPPYLDSVRRGSPADRVGLRPDDLIVFVEQDPIASHQEFLSRLTRIESDQPLRLSVLREGSLIEFQLEVDLPPTRPGETEID